MRYEQLNINGLIAAAFSPINSDGSANLKPIPKLVDELIENGVNGLYLMGSTGEGLSLTIEQRKNITEAYVSAVDKRISIIVNVSHGSYQVSHELTRHAIAIGANAVSATLPSYYKISSLEQLISAVTKIADCQDQVPFIYYHIPGKTGLNFKMYRFLENIQDKLPQLGGIKYTSGAIDDYILCEKFFGDRYKMFFGVDELFLPALAVGADSFIGSTYNFMYPYYRNVLESYGKGDKIKAIEEYSKIAQIIDVFLQYDGLAAQKAILKMMGHDFGPPKSPVLSLTDKEYDTLRGNLESLKFFQHPVTTKL